MSVLEEPMDPLMMLLFFCGLKGEIANVLTVIIGTQSGASLGNEFVKCFGQYPLMISRREIAKSMFLCFSFMVVHLAQNKCSVQTWTNRRVNKWILLLTLGLFSVFFSSCLL